MNPDFINFIGRKKILLVIGTGGVGKTTSSVGIALAAAREGKKVALLSIDPAKRLAAALGLSYATDLSAVKEYADVGGKLDAMMLDPKVVFDGLVKKFTQSEDHYKKILDNLLYKAASTKLAGTIEFMSLAKISEIYNTDRYDFIVVDTPPDTHSINFLCKPHILSSFQDRQVMKWIIRPISFATRFGLGKIVSLGEKMMSGLFHVTGLQAIHAISDFLILIQDVIKGLHHHGLKINTILASDECGFLLVGIPTEASLRGMVNLVNELETKDLKIDSILLNKCLPEEIREQILSKRHLPSFNDNKALRSFLNRAISEIRIKSLLNEKYFKSEFDHHLIFSVTEKDYPLLSVEAMEKF